MDDEAITMAALAEDNNPSISSANDTTFSDFEMENFGDETQLLNRKKSEKSLLLVSDRDLQRAASKRRAQILKVILVSVTCLLQTIALPLFYAEVENYWGEESQSLMMAAKYTLYTTYILSCLFAPVFLAMFGIKIILVAGSLSVCIFISANFFPLNYSSVPASMLTGLLMGPFFIAQGVFITNCAYRYCKTLTTCDEDVIINIANGIFYSIVLSAPIILNALKLLFIQPSLDVSAHFDNSSMSCSESHMCPFRDAYNHELFIMADKDNFNFSYHRIQALLGAHLALSFTGLILCALAFNSNHPVIAHLQGSKCTAPPKEYTWGPKPAPKPSNGKSMKEHFCESFRKWDLVFYPLKDGGSFVMLLPLFVYLGMQQGLIYNVFIKDVIGCRLDRQHVYFMRMVIAGSSVVIALPAAIVARYVGRLMLSLPAVAIQFSLILTIMLWQPGLAEWRVLYAVGALWGCADAVWQVLTSALVGRIFRIQKDAAFSHLRLWQMVGILLIDVLRTLLCLNFVLYILLAIFGIAYVAFVAFEIHIRLKLQECSASDSSHDVAVMPEQRTSWMPKLTPHPVVPRQRVSLTE